MFRLAPAVFFAILWTPRSLRDSNLIESHEASQVEEDVMNSPPGDRLAKAAVKTVQMGARNVKPGNAFKGNALKGANFMRPKPQGFAFSGPKLPSNAFNGFRGQMNGFRMGGMRGMGGGGAFGHSQLNSRMPVQNVARRFASGNAQVVNNVANAQLIGQFQSLPNFVNGQQLLNAVGKAVGKAAKMGEEETAKVIRDACHSVFKGGPGGAGADVHVLISRGEMQVAKASKDFLGRFKIRKGGKDLYVNILHRQTWGKPKQAVNYWPFDLDIARRSFEGVLEFANIHTVESLEYMINVVKNAVSKGGSGANMANAVEEALLQKWGNGWNVVTSQTEQKIAAHGKDILARFKVNDRFFTIMKQPTGGWHQTVGVR